METNEMEPGTRDEGREALEEFQRGHDEMGGAIVIEGTGQREDSVFTLPRLRALADPGSAT